MTDYVQMTCNVSRDCYKEIQFSLRAAEVELLAACYGV